MTADTQDVKTNLRLPEDLYDQVKRLAAVERRSVNAQMIVMLQEAVTARQAKQQTQQGNG
jgi:hypothetical protein